ncbi:MAG: hypothetical protein LiPW39_539 [Parcubacteria group bacterium LiPW_39]|nr:MAG: hypothetical protein LiPW39_539 [Parcubacteria group bacterium LiPW_39]
MNEKGRDDYSDDIGRKVYDLTWQGKLWGRGGAIELSRKRFKVLKTMGQESNGLFALASTHYTASGQANARAKQVWLFWKLAWWWRGFWYLWLAERLDGQAQRIKGIKNMTPGQLDVSASILAKAFFKPRRYEKAIMLINEALGRKNVAPHSRALLRVKLGEIYDILGRFNQAAIIYGIDLQVGGLEATTEVRVLKSFGHHYKRLGDKKKAREFLEKALVLAENHNLGDQVIKIKALM